MSYQAAASSGKSSKFDTPDRFSLEVYQAFMTGYVNRINEATMGVTIGGVRIGSAKYSRLAQINLKSRIITFSRYAIENVPERGRRYLVIHELAHVKEPSHNKHFWQIVERFEPNYKAVGRSLELAFKRNVTEDQFHSRNIKLENPLSGRLEEPKLLFMPQAAAVNLYDQNQLDEFDDRDELNDFLCNEGEFGDWTDAGSGIMHGGSELSLSSLNAF